MDMIAPFEMPREHEEGGQLQVMATESSRSGFLLKSIGINEKSGALMIRKEDYFDVINQMNGIHEPKYNAERYERLSKLGIHKCTLQAWRST